MAEVNWRLFFTTLWLFVAGGVSLFLMANEIVLRETQEGEMSVLVEDPLLDIEYSKVKRKQNFEAFGFEGKQLAEALRMLQDVEDEWGRRVGILLRKSGDPDALADALCGEASDARPRYAALPFIVTMEKGRRQTLNLRKSSTFEEQDWALEAPIRAVYEELELANDRHADATLMGIAAILLSKEQEVLDHNAPWGQGLTSKWSWARVQKENKTAASLVLQYFTTLHLVVEIAQEEGGICDG